MAVLIKFLISLIKIIETLNYSKQTQSECKNKKKYSSCKVFLAVVRYFCTKFNKNSCSVFISYFSYFIHFGSKITLVQGIIIKGRAHS